MRVVGDKWHNLSLVLKLFIGFFGILATIGGGCGLLWTFLPTRWLEVAVPVLLEVSDKEYAIHLKDDKYLLPADFASVFVVFIAFVISVITILLIVIIRVDRSRLGGDTEELRNALDFCSEELASSQSDLKLFLDRLNKITYQQYKIDDVPLYELKSVTWNVIIKENGDADVTHVYELTPRDKPGHIWTPSITVDPESAPVVSAFGIDVKVRDVGDGDTEVELLPRENEARKKKYAVYFLPQIEVGETRKIELTYTWPGWANQLLQTGRIKVWWNYSKLVEGTTTNYDIVIKFPKDLGHISCQKPYAKVAGEQLNFSSDGNGTVWRYQASNAPARQPCGLVFDMALNDVGRRLPASTTA